MLPIMEYILRGLLSGAVYGVLALPLSLVYVTTGTIDFAIGAYALIAGGVAFSAGPFGVPAGLLAALACSTVMGFVLLLLKRRGGEYGIAFILASFGMSGAIASLVLWRWGTGAFLSPLFPGVIELGPFILPNSGLANLLVGFLLVAVLYLVLYQTVLGKTMRAAAISSRAATLAGVHVEAIQFGTILAGGLVAGVAGLLIFVSTGMDYTSPLNLSFAAFGAAVVFGMDSPIRCFLGGLSLGVVEALSFGYASGMLSTMIPMIFVLVVLSTTNLGARYFTGDRP
jgi:branched-chain amino acid transport system permease protein